MSRAPSCTQDQANLTVAHAFVSLGVDFVSAAVAVGVRARYSVQSVALASRRYAS